MNIPPVLIATPAFVPGRLATTKPIAHPQQIQIGENRLQVSKTQHKLYLAIVNNNAPFYGEPDHDPMIIAIRSMMAGGFMNKGLTAEALNTAKNGHTLTTFFLAYCMPLFANDPQNREASLYRVIHILQTLRDHGADFALASPVNSQNHLPPIHFLGHLCEHFALWEDKLADKRQALIRVFTNPYITQEEHGNLVQREYDPWLRITYTYNNQPTDIQRTINTLKGERNAGTRLIKEDLMRLGFCESQEERHDRLTQEETERHHREREDAERRNIERQQQQEVLQRQEVEERIRREQERRREELQRKEAEERIRLDQERIREEDYQRQQLALIQNDRGLPYFSHLILQNHTPDTTLHHHAYIQRFADILRDISETYHAISTENTLTETRSETVIQNIRNLPQHTQAAHLKPHIQTLKALFLDILHRDRSIAAQTDPTQDTWAINTPVTELLTYLYGRHDATETDPGLSNTLKTPIVYLCFKEVLSSIIPRQAQPNRALDKSTTRLMYLFLAILSHYPHDKTRLTDFQNYGLDAELTLVRRGINLSLLKELNQTERTNLSTLITRASRITHLITDQNKLAMGKFMLKNHTGHQVPTEHQLNSWITHLEDIKNCFGNATITNDTNRVLDTALKSDLFFEMLSASTQTLSLLQKPDIGKLLSEIVNLCHPNSELEDSRFEDIMATVGNHRKNTVSDYESYLKNEYKRLEFRYNEKPSVFLDQIKKAFTTVSRRRDQTQTESPITQALRSVFPGYIQNFFNFQEYEDRFNLVNAMLIVYASQDPSLPVQHFLYFVDEVVYPTISHITQGYDIALQNTSIGTNYGQPDDYSGKTLLMQAAHLGVWEVCLYCLFNTPPNHVIQTEELLQAFFQDMGNSTSPQIPSATEARQLFLHYMFKVTFNTPEFFIVPFLDALIDSQLAPQGLQELLGFFDPETQARVNESLPTKLPYLLGQLNRGPSVHNVFQENYLITDHSFLDPLIRIISTQIDATENSTYLMFFTHTVLFEYINSESGLMANKVLVEKLFRNLYLDYPEEDHLNIGLTLSQLLTRQTFFQIDRYTFIRDTLLRHEFEIPLTIQDRVTIATLYLAPTNNESTEAQANFFNKLNVFLAIFSTIPVDDSTTNTGMKLIGEILKNPAIQDVSLSVISDNLIGKMHKTYEGIQKLQGRAQIDFFSKLKSTFDVYRNESLHTDWIQSLQQLDSQVKFQFKIQQAEDLLRDFIANASGQNYLEGNIETDLSYQQPIGLRMNRDTEITLQHEYTQMLNRVSTYIGTPHNQEVTPRDFIDNFANAIARENRMDIVFSLFEGVYLGTGGTIIPFPNQLITLLYILIQSETNSPYKVKVIGEVGTGEGKSLIIAMLSAYAAIKYQGRIDVVVSNDILAKRDATFFKPFFEKMGITHVYASDLPNDTSTPSIAYTTAVNLQKHVANCKNIPVNHAHEIPSMDTLVGKYLVVDEGDVLLIGSGNNDLKTTNDSQELSPVLADFVDELWTRTNNGDADTLRQASDMDCYAESSDLEKRFMETKFRLYLEGAQEALHLPEEEFRKKYWISDGVLKTRTAADDIFRISQDAKCTQVFLSKKLGLDRSYPLLSNFDITKLSILDSYPGISGFTGTLGNTEKEKNVLQNSGFRVFQTPRLASRPERIFKLLSNEQEWIRNIVTYTLDTAIRQGRTKSPVLVLVNTTSDLFTLHNALRAEISQEEGKLNRQNVQLGCNLRILDGNLNLPAFNELVDTIGQNHPNGYGFMTLATKVGHRGIDPEITGKELYHVGLTVIDTRLDLCGRDSIQKAGRAARNGMPGRVITCYCKTHIEADIADNKEFGTFTPRWTANDADNQNTCQRIQEQYVTNTLNRDTRLDVANTLLSELRENLITRLNEEGIQAGPHNRTMLIWWSTVKDIVRALVRYNATAETSTRAQEGVRHFSNQLATLLGIPKDPNTVYSFDTSFGSSPFEETLLTNTEEKSPMVENALDILVADLKKHIMDPKNGVIVEELETEFNQPAPQEDEY